MPSHPFDDRTPVTIDAGSLYVLSCTAAIALGSFEGNKNSKRSTLMAASVTVPAVKRVLIEQANWKEKYKDW